MLYVARSALDARGCAPAPVVVVAGSLVVGRLGAHPVGTTSGPPRRYELTFRGRRYRAALPGLAAAFTADWLPLVEVRRRPGQKF